MKDFREGVEVFALFSMLLAVVGADPWAHHPLWVVALPILSQAIWAVETLLALKQSQGEQ